MIDDFKAYMNELGLSDDQKKGLLALYNEGHASIGDVSKILRKGEFFVAPSVRNKFMEFINERESPLEELVEKESVAEEVADESSVILDYFDLFGTYLDLQLGVKAEIIKMASRYTDPLKEFSIDELDDDENQLDQMIAYLEKAKSEPLKSKYDFDILIRNINDFKSVSILFNKALYHQGRFQEASGGDFVIGLKSHPELFNNYKNSLKIYLDGMADVGLPPEGSLAYKQLKDNVSKARFQLNNLEGLERLQVLRAKHKEIEECDDPVRQNQLFYELKEMSEELLSAQLKNKKNRESFSL